MEKMKARHAWIYRQACYRKSSMPENRFYALQFHTDFTAASTCSVAESYSKRILLPCGAWFCMVDGFFRGQEFYYKLMGMTVYFDRALRPDLTSRICYRVLLDDLDIMNSENMYGSGVGSKERNVRIYLIVVSYCYGDIG